MFEVFIIVIIYFKKLLWLQDHIVLLWSKQAEPETRTTPTASQFDLWNT